MSAIRIASSGLAGLTWAASEAASVTSGRLVVDLGPLESAAEIDVDRLPLGERVERDVPGLAVAVPRVLPAAEREVRLGARRARVDIDDAGLEVAHRAEGRVDVAGVDRG